MFNKIACVLLLLVVALPARAQTATPTPCNPGLDIGHLNFGGNCQNNTVDADTKSDLYRVMATAAFQVNELPEQIQTSGQNGQGVIPSTSGAIQIFGYIKWMFSANTAQELMGRTLAPFGINIFIIFLMITIMTGLYFLVNFIVLIVKAVIWVFNQFLKLIPFW
jgi:hypothetical protein